ncbi:formyltransferase family protein [Winogradskyella sp.]|uniref:formyltransferase family protein n=1 Tax=Winogradskyella sp. TaxID=1883156 RepID=UPI0025D5F494|nr:formyltransferase family protein [Winogradskyella sp.]
MITLYLLGKKGLSLLFNVKQEDIKYISKVIIGKDKNVINDYSADIEASCIKNLISYVVSNNQKSFKTEYAIAVGWRQLINYTNNQRLIVFHDSILPRLRGFNPLVTSLINGDSQIGVTALFASNDYDKGDIIDCEKSTIEYPMKIEEAINIVSGGYSKLANRIISNIIGGKELSSEKQDESKATYSLWRNHDDYRINWSNSANKIARHIDAVGFPYTGAVAELNNAFITIIDSQPIDDVVIENRTVGKVIFKEDNFPIVVCGKGLLKVLNAVDSENKKIDFSKNFRLRFK